MIVKIGDVEIEAVFNGFTPIVFSRCFTVEKIGEDGNPTGRYRQKDINENVGQIADTMKACGMPPMAALLEILYACARTANPKFDEPFGSWVRSLPQEAFDLQKGDGWAADVMKIVEDNFFPDAPDGVDAKATEKAASSASCKS